MADETQETAPGMKLLLSEDRFFLVPADATLTPGPIEAMDLDGAVYSLADADADRFEVTREQAGRFVQGRMTDAFQRANDMVQAFTEVFRRTAADQGTQAGPDLAIVLRGMMDTILGVSGDPVRMAQLREHIEEVAADLEGADEERLAEALRTFPERLQAALAETRDVAEDDA
jgi:hypothetical protein